MIARFDVREYRRRHRGHSGCGCAALFGTFEDFQAIFEHRDRRIAEAAVLEARVFVLEARFGLFGALIDVALRQEERFGCLCELRAQDATVNEFRFRPPVSLSGSPPVIRHFSLAFHANKKPGILKRRQRAGRWKPGAHGLFSSFV
jgi:hypothetical protein